MPVARHSATRRVPLARMALLAGEAFGHQSTHDVALAHNAPSGQVRSALALVLIVCVLTAAYFAV